MIKKIILILITSYSYPLWAEPAELSPIEKNIADTVSANNTQALHLLEKLVNINSGTENLEGVYEVGTVAQKEFEKLGFTSEWKFLPANMERVGTLLLTRKGSQGKRLLLIAHLDTVFPKDSPFQRFKQKGNRAFGPGVVDDKGGIVLILYALKALHTYGALDNTSITVALVGDEENSGKPTSISRAALKQAALGMDVALDFEPASSLNTATISRRGINNWEISSKGREAHSSAIFQSAIGYGAILELARVLDTAQKKLASEQYATFNPGIIIGGTEAQIEKIAGKASGYGKNNVIAQIAKAKGDMRFISGEQQEFIKKTINEISKESLPGTSSVVTFEDAIPAMPPTANNRHLLEIYSEVSVDLGYGSVKAYPPELRGAADISHVAGIVPANLAGLGPIGGSTHSIHESMEIPSLNINTQRTALLIYRLTR